MIMNAKSMPRTIFSAIACCQILLTAIANGQVSPAVNRGSGRLAEGTGPSEVEMRLWPNGAPGLAADTAREITFIPDADIGRRVTKVTDPILTVYRPEASRATGAAVLICPGGGYNILAVVHEGIDVARWLNQLGVTGIVLQYRVMGMACARRQMQCRRGPTVPSGGSAIWGFWTGRNEGRAASELFRRYSGTRRMEAATTPVSIV